MFEYIKKLAYSLKHWLKLKMSFDAILDLLHHYRMVYYVNMHCQDEIACVLLHTMWLICTRGYPEYNVRLSSNEINVNFCGNWPKRYSNMVPSSDNAGQRESSKLKPFSNSLVVIYCNLVVR